MWTKDVPTGAGYYWCRWRSNGECEVVEVFMDGDVLSVAWIAEPYPEPINTLKCEWWSKPIQEPSKPKEPK
jgi:hypothetical protein